MVDRPDSVIDLTADSPVVVRQVKPAVFHVELADTDDELSTGGAVLAERPLAHASPSPLSSPSITRTMTPAATTRSSPDTVTLDSPPAVIVHSLASQLAAGFRPCVLENGDNLPSPGAHFGIGRRKPVTPPAPYVPRPSSPGPCLVTPLRRNGRSLTDPVDLASPVAYPQPSTSPWMTLRRLANASAPLASPPLQTPLHTLHVNTSPVAVPSSPLSCTSQRTDILTDTSDTEPFALDESTFESAYPSDDEQLPMLDAKLSRTSSFPTVSAGTALPMGRSGVPAPITSSLDLLRWEPSATATQPLTSGSLRRAHSSSVAEGGLGSPNARLSARAVQRSEREAEKTRKRESREQAKQAARRAKEREQQIKRLNRIHLDKLECSREITVRVGHVFYDWALTDAERNRFAAQVREQRITYTKRAGSAGAHHQTSARTNAAVPSTTACSAVTSDHCDDDDGNGDHDSDGPWDPGYSVGTLLEAHLRLHLHADLRRAIHLVPHAIQWERHVQNRFDAESGLFVPIEPSATPALTTAADPAVKPYLESVVLLYWTAAELEQYGRCPGRLEEYCQSVRAHFAHAQTTVLLLQGFEPWCKRQYQRRDRDFARQVRMVSRHNSAPASLPGDIDPEVSIASNSGRGRGRGRGRSRGKQGATAAAGDPSNPDAADDESGTVPNNRGEDEPAWTPERAEEALVWLEVNASWLISHAKTVHEAAQWLTVLTRDIGARRYKDRTHIVSSGVDPALAGRHRSGDHHTTDRLGSPPRPAHPDILPGASRFTIESGIAKAQLNPADIWFRMLMQVPKLTEPVARAIVTKYPSLQSLYRAYQSPAAQTEPDTARLLLADLLVGPAGTRRIGPVMSAKVHQIFTSRNPALNL
ncbi:hypothetical protein IWQ60_002185 [Tieghemiomyces parasiticus]|uniref:ERCC4 domain-containing protein n=1 Tax=Tieghemiomyces parasiticus TaxID=78921 RepID=A0A9W8E173_9FUNG|nr:hypothetical protein IWQ60_002185 [Tieghemiomyces parasiticus]